MLGSVVVYRRLFKRFRSSEWITPNHLAKRRWIKGRVVSVGDADNFRLYHTPGFGWSWPLKFRRVPSTPAAQKNETIHIRIAGADAPEAAHFGRPAQPYAREALDFLKSKVEGKKVYCQLIRRDQYGRVVAHVHLDPLLLPGSLFTGKPLALDMVRSGWATTYTQAGAEYGTWGKGHFLQLEEEAKSAKRGIWAKGTSGETPAEYKRRHAALAAGGKIPSVEKDVSPKAEEKGWLRRLFSRS